MNVSYEWYSSLEKLFDSRTAEFKRNGNFLIKYYYYLKIGTKEKLEYLLNKPYILGSGLPIDEVFLYDSFRGIVINYFENAVPFLKTSDFSIEEKIKACLDISRQLNTFHGYEMYFNDIQCDNLLIDKDGGHLIDFDNASFFGSFDASSRYNLRDDSGNIILSSVKVDLYKALICYLSLFYNIDFLKKVYNCSNNSISNFLLLFDNTSIFPLLNRATNSVSIDDIPFPDIKEFIPFLLDKERFNYDLDKVKDKVKMLR